MKPGQSVLFSEPIGVNGVRHRTIKATVVSVNRGKVLIEHPCAGGFRQVRLVRVDQVQLVGIPATTRTL